MSRASGIRALTAAIKAPWLRKLAASQPTRRMSAAVKRGGRNDTTSAVASGAPGTASPSTAALANRMKIAPNYTREDFQRDWSACTRNGKVDDACMRNLGWVAVNPGGSIERPKDPHARDLAPPSARGDRRY